MAEKRKSRNTPTKPAKKTKASEGGFDPLPPSDVYKNPWEALGGWFLGPRAENRNIFNELTTWLIDQYSDHREAFYPADPCYITEDIKDSTGYKSEIKDLREQLSVMNDEMSESTPFFSSRYQGHMIWENTMPAQLGYFLGMLWNQNNVDSTISPVTTAFEMKVGQHLCELMNFKNDETVTPWGHLTSGGSVANLESMWSARNLKFFPVAMQATCNGCSGLSSGGRTLVYVPELNKSIQLKDCTTWQLLNLDVDTVCSLQDSVLEMIGLEDKQLLEQELEKHSIVNIGFLDFCQKHKIKSPAILSPGTNHYSWPKNATALGLGSSHVLPIHVDANSRLKIEDLRRRLRECLNAKIPVIMCVAVIGSTEESAVDPIAEMYSVREEFRLEGMNFSLHADGAWGGYLLTMLKPPSGERKDHCNKRDEAYVPSIPLSEYAKKQYQAIRNADTVTIDPHKAGFCQYPAGAMCYRNGKMKNLIKYQAAEVFHGEDDPSVGVYGLEGSKPGAAACGVLLSHRVIGLDQMGYGRILGQCQLGSKLFYCLWMTVAEPYDNFACETMIDLPKLPSDFYYPCKTPKEYIKKYIIGRENEELSKDARAMAFLKRVGPDALINSFVVNKVGNTDVQLCNDLQDTIFNEMNATVGQSPKRIPMFLTTSTLLPIKYGEAVEQLKTRLGFENNPDENLGFLRQTCNNPFQCSEQFVVELGKLFRNTCTCAVAAMGGEDGDSPLQHTFVVAGPMKKKGGKVFLDYSPSYANSGSQYHVVVSMKPTSDSDVEKFRSRHAALRRSNTPVFMRTKSNMMIRDLLRNYTWENTDGNKIQMEVVKGKPDGAKLFEVTMQVDEVFRFNRLESLEASRHIEYPDYQTYFMYGDEKRAFISHVMTKHDDFHQVVQLDAVPHSVPVQILDLGMLITLPDIQGSPLYLDGEISDPLQATTYTAEYKGKQYTDCKTTIALGNKHAKRWFDADRLNATS